MANAAPSPSSDPEVKIKVEDKPTLTPPASEEADKHDDSGSELSDLEPDLEDNLEVVPDHYYDGGKIPVFKPTMDQFRSFKTFVQKIDKYGMKSGIVKIIPPQEWRDSLPPLDEQVKTIRVKNPITQEFHGTHGTYTQANIEKQRSYSLPQWKALSEESNHQPPARRGERRRNQEKSTRGGGGAPKTAKKASLIDPDGRRRGPGRPRVRPLPTTTHKHEADISEEEAGKIQIPPTPTSPSAKPSKIKKEVANEDRAITPSKPKGRQPKSVSSRRKHNSRDQTDVFDEEAFRGFDYRVHNQDEWTPERCQELETAYWKSLTFNNPLYGADMPGSLFDDSTESWNVSKLENLLDVLGQKVPGVNTTYLYLGMWKATFAWHLEDVDLYSINYIHFGAPKQWYSISQEDARKFEAAMRSVWPNDAKNCDQFLRHKTYLISPQLLQSQYNIKVNRLVHNEGEFVITYPYGYHSGYNLGYNCAESVNFATESWLDYGRVAKKCNCEADSVWVDVTDIERKLRGEQTPEYYEETDDEEDEEDEEEEDLPTDLPTPPGSDKGKPKARSHKRKRDATDKDPATKIKKIRIRVRVPVKEPCTLCPNDNRFEKLLPTDNSKEAHRRCALYTPETYIAEESGKEKVCDVNRIDKARWELKCNYCRIKRGAAFQCSQKKCTRAYHATCAAAAGVQVDIGIIPVFGEDGTEYTDTGIDFRCRFHRVRRAKFADKESCIANLEESSLIRRYATKLPIGEVVQVQYYQSDIFAGVVVENRRSEQTLLLEVLPKGDFVEVEYKWLLVFDPANSQLPMPSENAKPLPAHLARKSQTTAEDPSNDNPKTDDLFCTGTGDAHNYVWSEFHTAKFPQNSAQVKVDLSKSNSLWFYLGKSSTEAKAQYTANPAIEVNDLAANFLESVKPIIAVAPPVVRRSYPASYPTSSGININAVNAARVNYIQQQVRPQPARPPPPSMQEKPYNGKYAIKDSVSYSSSSGCRTDQQPQHNPQPLVDTRSSHHAILPTMAEVQRRQSDPHYKSLNDYHRIGIQPNLIHGAAYSPPLSHYNHPQSQHQPQSISCSPLQHQPQAPVANMMASASPPERNPFSRPTSSHVPSPSTTGPVIQNRSRSASLEQLTKYPYLYEAAIKRPAVYESPYAVGGGFTQAWLPNPATAPPRHVRTTSISQEYLMKRTPSQQAHVKAHVRHVSTDKATSQQRKQRETQNRQLESKQRALMPPPIPPSASLSLENQQTLPQMHHNQSFHPELYHQQQTYTRPPAFPEFHSPYDPPSHTYSNLLHQDHGSFPSSHSFQPPGLQFQSPRDFQLQMQRDTQQGKEPGGYEAFMREMQEVGNVHPHSHGSQDGPEHGSPLRQGMRAAGGEMLPMMRDQY